MDNNFFPCSISSLIFFSSFFIFNKTYSHIGKHKSQLFSGDFPIPPSSAWFTFQVHSEVVALHISMIIHSFDDINIEKNFKLASEGTLFSVLMKWWARSRFEQNTYNFHKISSQLFISRTEFQIFMMHNRLIRVSQYFSCLSRKEFLILSIKRAHELICFLFTSVY